MTRNSKEILRDDLEKYINEIRRDLYEAEEIYEKLDNELEIKRKEDELRDLKDRFKGNI